MTGALTVAQLLGPRAFGEVSATARLKACAEDFQVDEVLDIPLAGEGEHLWLWVEKRELNTEEAAKRLAKAAGVSLRMVSYAGLKDRLALTRQWFSIHLPGQQDPVLAAAENENLTILQQVRHRRKLQRGAHSANGFTLRLTQLSGAIDALEQRLETIKQQGVPNYFGPQRFGFEGGNVLQALHYAQGAKLPEKRNVRSRLLSAARSYIFNQVLAERVADGSWNQAREGDVLAFTDSRSFFLAGVDECQDPRLAQLDLHPTGPLWGACELPSQGRSLVLEQRIAEQNQLLCDWLTQAGLEQERRVLRLPISGLTWHYPAADILQLKFVLPTGCYATSVVRELVDLLESTDTSCAF